MDLKDFEYVTEGILWNYYSLDLIVYSGRFVSESSLVDQNRHRGRTGVFGK